MDSTLHCLLCYYQGARNLAKPPTLTEIFLSNLKNSEEEGKHEDLKQSQEEKQESQKSLKRKYDPEDCSDCQVDDSHTQKEESPKEKKMMKRAKNVGFSLCLFCFLTMINPSSLY